MITIRDLERHLERVNDLTTYARGPEGLPESRDRAAQAAQAHATAAVAVATYLAALQ